MENHDELTFLYFYIHSTNIIFYFILGLSLDVNA